MDQKECMRGIKTYMGAVHVFPKNSCKSLCHLPTEKGFIIHEVCYLLQHFVHTKASFADGMGSWYSFSLPLSGE